MLQSTRGLVFHVARYSDSSGLVKIFTEEVGLQSCIVKSLYSRNSKIKPALFGHLSLLDLVIDNKPGRPIQYIREASVNRFYHEISDNIARTSVMLFINELLYKAIKEEEANTSLFEFIEYTLECLNNKEIPANLFHLLFLIMLLEHLGFGPSTSLETNGEHFDLLTGIPVEDDPKHSYVISGNLLQLLRQMTRMDYTDLVNFSAPRKVRFDLLNTLLDFLRIHIPEMAEIKSVKVLHEILS
jgi:DNA repair protein RecO (recombination protein O)